LRGLPEELRTSRAVLGLLLAARAGSWSGEEIIRVLAEDSERFADRDVIEICLRELVGFGLLHRQGGFYFPTRAAIHAALLLCIIAPG
jgi:hypothetical protein